MYHYFQFIGKEIECTNSFDGTFPCWNSDGEWWRPVEQNTRNNKGQVCWTNETFFKNIVHQMPVNVSLWRMFTFSLSICLVGGCFSSTIIDSMPAMVKVSVWFNLYNCLKRTPDVNLHQFHSIFTYFNTKYNTKVILLLNQRNVNYNQAPAVIWTFIVWYEHVY